MATKKKSKSYNVELNYKGYFIFVDRFGYILKQKTKGETKSGKEKESEKFIGFYNKLHEVIPRIVKLEEIEELDGQLLDFQKMIETYEKLSVEVLDKAKDFMIFDRSLLKADSEDEETEEE